MASGSFLARPVRKGVLVAIAALALLLVASLDSLAVRMSGIPVANHCYYRLVGKIPPDLDVLLIGSSRMLQGVDPDQLGRLLRVEGRPAKVVNFAHPGRLVHVDVVLLELITRKSTPKLIVIETDLGVRGEFVRTPRPPDVRAQRQAANADSIYLVSTYAQLVERGAKRDHQDLVPRLHSMLNDLERKVDRGIKITFSGRLLQTITAFNTLPMDGRDNICFSKFWGEPGFQKPEPVWEARKTNLRDAFQSRHSDWFADGYSGTTFLTRGGVDSAPEAFREVVAMARERGVKVLFHHIPYYYVWPPSPEFRAEFEREIGAPVVWPDKRFLKKLQDESGYRDQSHLFPHGRRLMSEWLANSIDALGLLK